MRCRVVWGPEADRDFATLPPLIASFLLDEIDRLAGDPVGLGKPSHFPFRLDRRLFQAKKEDDDGRVYHLAVLFAHLPGDSLIFLMEIGCNIEDDHLRPGGTDNDDDEDGSDNG